MLAGAMDAQNKQRVREVLQLMQHLAATAGTPLQRVWLLHGKFACLDGLNSTWQACAWLAKRHTA